MNYIARLKRVSNPQLGFRTLPESGQLGLAALVHDGFDRADSTVSLGAAPTGQAWVPQAGSLWGIDNGQAFMAGFAAQATVVVNTGAANCHLSFFFTQYGADAGVCFRNTDGLNHFVSNRTSLFRRQAGAFTKLGDFLSPYGTGDSMAVLLSGATISVFRNDVLNLSVTDTFNQTATQHGFRSNNDVSTHFDEFQVLAI